MKTSHRSNPIDALKTPLFYTFSTANHDSSTTSAIVHTNGCGAVVVQDTLDEVMALLNIRELGNKKLTKPNTSSVQMKSCTKQFVQFTFLFYARIKRI